MKRMLCVTIAALFFYSTNLFAQDFEVPSNVQLTTKDDYTLYEKDIISAEKWLIATPLNEQADKRKAVGAFVLQWVSGSPTVNCDMTPIITDFEKKNPGMLIIYMAATSRFVLENNYTKDRNATHKAAIMGLIETYKTNKAIQKDKKMDKLIKAESEGKMDEWLADNLKTGS